VRAAGSEVASRGGAIFRRHAREPIGPGRHAVAVGPCVDRALAVARARVGRCSTRRRSRRIWNPDPRVRHGDAVAAQHIASSGEHDFSLEIDVLLQLWRRIYRRWRRRVCWRRSIRCGCRIHHRWRRVVELRRGIERRCRGKTKRNERGDDDNARAKRPVMKALMIRRLRVSAGALTAALRLRRRGKRSEHEQESNRRRPSCRCHGVILLLCASPRHSHCVYPVSV